MSSHETTFSICNTHELEQKMPTQIVMQIDLQFIATIIITPQIDGLESMAIANLSTSFRCFEFPHRINVYCRMAYDNINNRLASL